MPTKLFALILEDNLADFELIAHELARYGFNALCKRVETEADYTERLREMPDIVLANYSLAGFDNLRALEILHRSGLVIPFIVLTGTFGEDEVIECMQKGATEEAKVAAWVTGKNGLPVKTGCRESKTR